MTPLMRRPVSVPYASSTTEVECRQLPARIAENRRHFGEPPGSAPSRNRHGLDHTEGSRRRDDAQHAEARAGQQIAVLAFAPFVAARREKQHLEIEELPEEWAVAGRNHELDQKQLAAGANH